MTVLVVLVPLGLDAILRTSEFAFVTLKWLGVLYILFLAWQFWRADFSTEIVIRTTSRLMRREFWTLMGNPKAYLLLTSFLPQFVDHTVAVTPQVLTLGAL
ncbi:LysE family translocator [Salipiger sp. PrR007]|uniref:LysE family translocator n=1 Tax=Salipiger sp. PrR007 TaxID=2706884 RepID=UPI0013B97CD3|nr:LysE family transporter [Salipiger sp. PrR007]NDW34194.1 LysE family transporter [Salipiger sp. PrR007]